MKASCAGRQPGIEFAKGCIGSEQITLVFGDLRIEVPLTVRQGNNLMLLLKFHQLLASLVPIFADTFGLGLEKVGLAAGSLQPPMFSQICKRQMFEVRAG